MSRVSFEHVRRRVIHHITGVGQDLEGAFVVKKEWVFVVVLVVQRMVCGRRQKLILAETKQTVSHLWSFESVYPVLGRCSCFSPVARGRGCKEILTSRSSKWLKLRGKERDMVAWLQSVRCKVNERRRRNVPAENCVVESLNCDCFFYFQSMPLGECKKEVWWLPSLQQKDLEGKKWKTEKRANNCVSVTFTSCLETHEKQQCCSLVCNDGASKL